MIQFDPVPMTYSIVIIGLSRTVSEINGDLIRKSQNFPTPVFCAPAERVPLGIGYRRKGSKTSDGQLQMVRKSFVISLSV